MNYKMVINFSSFNEVSLMDTEIDGEKIEGVFIPLRSNGIIKRGKYLNSYFNVVEKYNNVYGQSHYIKHSFTQKWKDKIGLLGMGEKIVGSLKPVHFRKIPQTYSGIDKINEILK